MIGYYNFEIAAVGRVTSPLPLLAFCHPWTRSGYESWCSAVRWFSSLAVDYAALASDALFTPERTVFLGVSILAVALSCPPMEDI